MKCGRAIRYFDQYGHRINLNFKREGEIVKTNLGGIVSIFIAHLILIYAIKKLNIMFSF